MDVKPGWQTSEFYVTILGNIVGIVALFKPTVANQVVSYIPQLAGILVIVATSVSYIISRNNVKATAVTAAAAK